jgi:sigma-B regulation protein RsbU (phosphoserine phosphatase)
VTRVPAEPATAARVLLVETDEGIREALLTELRCAGCAVQCTGDPEEALALAGAGEVDLVLVALDREGLNSSDLIPRLRSAAAGIPLMALGAEDTTHETFARAIDLGADDYLRAPFNPTILRARAATALDRRTLRASAETGLLKLQQLSHHLQDVILPLGVSLSAEKDVDRLLERILLEAKKLCHADAGTLYVRTKDDRLKFSIMLTDSLGIALGGSAGTEITFAPLRLKDPETGAPNHRNIATHVALHGHSVNIADIYGTDAFDFTGTREFDRKNNYRSTSTLTVPLKDNADQVIAVLQLLNALDPVTGEVIGFDSYQQLVVESLGSQAAVVFNNQLLLQRQEELLKFERDLQIGRQIQAGFLPEVLPAPAGYEVAARFMPAREVAGDFYDAFMLGPHTMGFVVADVCDKGVGAALFMALVRSLVRVYTQQRYAVLAGSASEAAAAEPPQDVTVTGRALQQSIVLANDYIGENHLNMNMFATMFAGMLNLQTGEIAYVNAGHNAPILLQTSGGTLRLPSRSPAVGMMPGFAFQVEHTQLHAGDLLVVFSDGIPDARDPHGRFFTEAKLVRMTEAVDPSTPAERVASDVQDALVAHIATAAQFDDITMMVIRRNRAL